MQSSKDTDNIRKSCSQILDLSNPGNSFPNSKFLSITDYFSIKKTSPKEGYLAKFSLLSYSSDRLNNCSNGGSPKGRPVDILLNAGVLVTGPQYIDLQYHKLTFLSHHSTF